MIVEDIAFIFAGIGSVYLTHAFLMFFNRKEWGRKMITLRTLIYASVGVIVLGIGLVLIQLQYQNTLIKEYNISKEK